MRFQHSLAVTWDLAVGTMDTAVPTLLWQPLVENAIHHGLRPRQGTGRIHITTRRDGVDMVLSITDNGCGLPVDGHLRQGGMGLSNVRERLAQLYGERASLALEPARGGGAVATMRWPFELCYSAHTPAHLRAISVPGDTGSAMIRGRGT